MTSSELIGRVAALYLRDQLLPDTTPTSGASGADDDNSQGTARFLIDSLSADQTACVARAVLADAELAPLFDIKLPETYMVGQGLPPEILTTEPAVSPPQQLR